MEGLRKLSTCPALSSVLGAKSGRSQGPSGQNSCSTPPSAEAVSELPLFGYTVYMVLRVSKPALPSPGLLGLNRQHLILMDPSSQVGQAPGPLVSHHLHRPLPQRNQAPLSLPVPPPRPQDLCCSIALRDLQRLRVLSPLGPEDSPGLELNYGSADNPQTIWFELPQVGGLCALRRWQAPHPGLVCPGAWAQASAHCSGVVGLGAEAGGWLGSPGLTCLCPRRPRS